VSPPYAAYLRVYEPLSAFDEGERARWTRYVAEQRAPSPLDGPAVERDAGLSCLLSLPPRLPGERDVVEHAFVADLDGTTVLCPWRTRVRCWGAAAELPRLMPTELAELMLPDGLVTEATEAYSGWRSSHPSRRVHVRTHRWAIPVRWFVLFEAAERRLDLGRPTSRGGLTRTGRSVVYRTEMAWARRRVARGLAVLRRAMTGAPEVRGVEELGRWLEEFHPRSMVELDYGGLVYLLDDDTLQADESARDARDALVALARGDASGAAAAYDRIITRWQSASFVESAN
jgi:hypothetical protein